jgi:transposase
MRPEVRHAVVVKGVRNVGLKRRKFTREFKQQVVREVEAGKSVAQAAREYDIHPTQITKWRTLLRQYAEHAFAGNGKSYRNEAREAELERMVGQLTMENALLKKALLRLEGSREPRSSAGGRGWPR